MSNTRMGFPGRPIEAVISLTTFGIENKIERMNATVELELPEGVKVSEAELKMILAAKLFEMGELSSGQAARMVGITRREFLESVGKYGVSIFQYDAEELEEDLARL